MLESDYEVVIIGAGPAGLSVALTLARARRHVLVIDSGSQRNRMAAHTYGFLTRDGVSPRDFFEESCREVLQYGGEIISGTVSSLEIRNTPRLPPRLVVRSNDQIVHTSALLAATGLTDQLPNIRGINDLWGSLVHHCSYCHGADLNPSDHVVVIGGNNPTFIIKQARLLCQWVGEVTFVTCGMNLDEETRQDFLSRNVKVIDDHVEIVGRTPTGKCFVQNRSGLALNAEAIFVGPVFKPNDSLLRQLGCEIGSSDWVKVDNHGRTSVSRVWAAGNVVSPPAQLINAAAAGITAAISINDTLTGA